MNHYQTVGYFVTHLVHGVERVEFCTTEGDARVAMFKEAFASGGDYQARIEMAEFSSVVLPSDDLAGMCTCTPKGCPDNDRVFTVEEDGSFIDGFDHEKLPKILNILNKAYPEGRVRVYKKVKDVVNFKYR